MRVVVTGASGLCGRHVAAALRQSGHDVVGVDRVPPRDPREPHVLVDAEDLGSAFGALAGADAVVHLAAIPRPVFHTDEVVFRTNVMSLFNVLHAAQRLGIDRVVWASSISALGFPFSPRPLAPDYVPIDEDHPTRPADPYALSKRLGEEMAEAFVRRGIGSVVSLRMPWIQTPETFEVDVRPLQADPHAGAANLWSYVDARDVAQAVGLALDRGLDGHRVFFVSAGDSFMSERTVDLVMRFYPKADVRSGLDGNASLLSTVRARLELGYRPEHSWARYGRDAA